MAAYRFILEAENKLFRTNRRLNPGLCLSFGLLDAGEHHHAIVRVALGELGL
jgi:hypothetical protein